MLPSPWRTGVRATWLGALSGLRALVPLSYLVRQHARASGLGGPWPVLRRWPVRALLRASMVGELVFDKLPGVPSRLDAPALAGRFATGAVSGAAVFSAARRSAWIGALLGTLGAYVGAVVGHRLRVGRAGGERAHRVRGFVEDVFVMRRASHAARALPIAGAV